jgi:hypothetical protein
MASKAAICGINEYKSVNHLQGCVNDVKSMQTLLTETYGFKPENIRTATNKEVTKTRVQDLHKWLFQDVGAGDQVLFHFSGHGSQIDDRDGDEDSDGVDELLCLYDMDFNDPNTYFLDDELRKWTQSCPNGVRLTVVLDNCHSGTGTRMLIAPQAGKPARPAMVDTKSSISRSMQAKPGTRDLGMREVATVAAESLDLGSKNLVLARYVEPPPAILQRIEAARQRRRRGSRDLVRADMNHVLLAACKDEQTAADAYIDGNFHGAFTYYLTKALTEAPTTACGAVITALEGTLRQNAFVQVPQFEGPKNRPFDRDPIFIRPAGGAAAPASAALAQADGAAAPPAPAGPPPGPSAPSGPGPKVSPMLQPVTPAAAPSSAAPADAGRQALYEQVRQKLEAGEHRVHEEVIELIESYLKTTSARVGRAVGGRSLVYVHGIGTHTAGYSDSWWNALHPYTAAFGDGKLDDTRHEVIWSNIVEDRDVRAISPAESQERAQFAAQVKGALEDRAATNVIELGPSTLKPELSRAVVADRGLNIPGLNYIEDFAVYMFDDAVRQKIIGAFLSVVQPLLEASDELDLISHSWGTVVAYEGLRELDRAGSPAGRVHNFFTVGSALSIYPVKLRLKPENRDGRKPAVVDDWINLNAVGDPVGGRLQGNPFVVDAEFLGLSNLGCGWFDAVCAHTSYFVPANQVVNRDIFAAFIARA